MKKLFQKTLALSLMLLMSVSMWAVDWSGIDYLGDGAGGGAYNNKYKFSGDGSPVNIQQPGTPNPGIYLTFPDAAFGEVRINDAVADYNPMGAAICIYLSNFTAKQTEVNVMNSANTDVRWTFFVYNEDGEGELPTDEPGGETEPTEIDWSTYSWVANSSDKFKVGALSAANMPMEIINVQQPGFATKPGIYMTFPGAVSDCSHECGIQGGGICLYIDQFVAKETEVTVNYVGGSKTFVVFYADGTEGSVAPESKFCATPADAVTEAHGSCSPLFTINTLDDGNVKIVISAGEGLDGETKFRNGGMIGTFKLNGSNADFATYFDKGKTDDYTYMLTLKDPANKPVDGAIISYSGQIECRSNINTDDWSSYKLDDYVYGSKCPTDVAVTGVTLDQTEASVPVNKTLTLIATIAPANAANKTVVWTTSDEAIAKVVDGVVTPQAVGGPVTITARTEDGNFTATCAVTVTAAKATEPTAAPEAPTYAADKVRALYSATYSTDCNHGAWGGSQSFDKQAVGIKIVLNPGNGFVGLVGFPARDCSTMEKFHADVWVEDNARMRFVPITGQAERGVFKDLAGGQWNSIEIALNEGDWAQTTDWSNVYQLKIDNAPGLTFWINNVYFYTTSEDDVTKPVMTSASLESASYLSAIINVAATDDRGVTKYIVKNGDAEVGKFVPADGKITVTGLTDGTAYTLSIYAQDAAENVSDNKIDVELTTLAMPEAPTAPDVAAKDYRAVYAPSLTNMLAHDFTLQNWGSAAGTKMTDKGYIFYHTTNNASVVWGENNAGAAAIVATDAYKGNKGGLDASAMEFMHMDIWADKAGCNSMVVVIDDRAYNAAQTLNAGWNSIDLAMSNFAWTAKPEDYNQDNVAWIKFTGLNNTNDVAITNVYFWISTSTTKTVTATKNIAEAGTAVVKQEGVEVTEAENGSEVTFHAEANDGYLFLGWYAGAELKSTDADYVVTVDGNTTLQARFRALNNIYCHTELTSTAGDKHIVLTMKRTAENQYQVIIDSEENMSGFGNAYIGGVNGAGNQINLRDASSEQYITFSPDKHHITINIESTTAIKWNTPVYINMPTTEYRFDDPWNKAVEYEVACEAVPVETVTLNKTTANVAIDEHITLVATVAPLSAENRTVLWATSDDAVASVVDGVVTGIAEGEATITATSAADPTKSASCVVSVVAPYAKVCWGNGSDAGIALDYSFTYGLDKKVTIFMAPVHDKTGFNMQVNDGDYRTATAVEGGYTYSDGLDHEEGDVMSGFFYMSFAGGAGRVDYHYTVGDECEKPVVHVTGMQISAEEQTMAVSETVTLTANVLPLNADNKTITWSSDNDAVATVNATTGLVTAVAQGTANIVATSEDGGLTATCVVTVVAGIEPTVYRAAGVFGGDPAVNMTYSITRNADRSLTFVVVLDAPIAGNKDINIGNGFEHMDFDAETLIATFTTETKYADGFKSSEWFFYFGGRRIDFKYEVGYETPEVRDDLVVNNFKGMYVDGDVAANNFVGAEFYEVDYKTESGSTVSSITLVAVDHLVAGKGYITFATMPSLFCNFVNGTVGTASSYNDSGDAIHVNKTGANEPVPENAGCFLLINNKLYECGTGCQVRPGSIYIRMTEVGTAPSAAPGRRRVIGNAQAPSTPTALDNISDDSNVEARKVVKDGSVFILRSNRIYNTMGQLVK